MILKPAFAFAYALHTLRADPDVAEDTGHSGIGLKGIAMGDSPQYHGCASSYVYERVLGDTLLLPHRVPLPAHIPVFRLKMLPTLRTRRHVEKEMRLLCGRGHTSRKHLQVRVECTIPLPTDVRGDLKPIVDTKIAKKTSK